MFTRLLRIHLSPGIAVVLCGLIVCATLTAGLWPFHAPENRVQWVPREHALRFVRYGTALSPGRIAQYAGGDCSVEVWLKPALVWTLGSIVSFYDADTGRQFSVEQNYTDLVLRLDSWTRREGDSQWRVNDLLRKPELFVTVTTNGRNVALYVDGALVASSSSFDLTAQMLASQLILANSPRRNYAWPGELKGMAIYPSQLSPEEVAKHYRQWTLLGTPVIQSAEQPLALYRFSERGGNVIHNELPGGVDLEIPEKFVVVDQVRFESPVSEFRIDQSYFKDAIINVLGFIPLGFLFCLYFGGVRGMKHAGLLAIMVGALVSLTIESAQAFLPTRYSGVTDLITNTVGTAVGVVVYRGSRWLVARSNQPS